MRIPWLGALIASLSLAVGPVRADDQADARLLLDKALKAMGGEAKVAALRAGTYKGKATANIDGQELAANLEATWQGLDHYRAESEFQVGGQTEQFLLVINGDKGWGKERNKVQEPPEGIVPFTKGTLYTMRMPHLLPALKDPAFKLSPLGETKVGDRAAVGLTVAHKDYRDVSLFFDKETGLPLRTEMRLTGPEGKEITLECLYSDYKDFAGLKHPARVQVKGDGKEFILDVSELKPLDRVDESLFAKP